MADDAAAGLHWDAGNFARTYETFAAAAKKHFAGIERKLVVAADRRMGSATACSDNERRGVLGIDVDPERSRSAETAHRCNVTSLDEALRI